MFYKFYNSFYNIANRIWSDQLFTTALKIYLKYKKINTFWINDLEVFTFDNLYSDCCDLGSVLQMEKINHKS